MITITDIYSTVETSGYYKGYPVIKLCLDIHRGGVKYTTDMVIQITKQKIKELPHKPILVIEGNYNLINSSQLMVLCVELHKHIPKLIIILHTCQQPQNKVDTDYMVISPTTVSYSHLRELFQHTPQYTQVDYLFNIQENRTLTINLLNRLYKENILPDKEVYLHPLNEYEHKQLLEDLKIIQFPFIIQ